MAVEVLLKPTEWENSTLPRIRRRYSDFSQDQTSELQTNLWDIRKDFGPKGDRWWWDTVDVQDKDGFRHWEVEFIFKNPQDALLFGLKY